MTDIEIKSYLLGLNTGLALAIVIIGAVWLLA